VGDGLIGLYQIATEISLRRMGYAKALVSALMQWGADKGAGHAYLQVEAGNAAARPLYASLGFQTHYSYDYWAL
jgi:ribosomal protein S18 acetylase RimI-like enzyme